MSTNITIDLSNYRDRVGSRVPEGRYTVVVDDLEPDESKAGNPMINMWLRIVAGPDDDYIGHVIIDRLTITDKALFRVVAFMNAIGLKTPKKRLSVNVDQWLGKSLDVDVEDGEPYNNRVKSEVRGYLKATRSAPTADLDDVEDIEEALPAETVEVAAEAEDAEVDLDTVTL